jgi:hypothetical protein
MSFDAATVRAPRCTLVNVSTAESIECLFNPTQLAEKLQVNWNRLVVPGLSHQVLQFQSTSNAQLPNVEFYLDRFFATANGSDAILREFRAFLRSLTVPVGRTETVAATAPPRVIVIWPEVLTLECVVGSVEFQYRQFGADGRVLVYTATVGFEAILDMRVTSEPRRRPGNL